MDGKLNQPRPFLFTMKPLKTPTDTVRSKTWPVLLGLLLAATTAQAQFKFIIATNNGAITIKGYSGSSQVVVIPATTNNLPVTTIGSAAFMDDSQMTSVTIPNSITNIGTQAFFYCSSLTNVTIPGSVISMGSQAFWLCGLTSVAFSNGVTSIGTNAFESCQYLVNVMIPDSVTNLGDGAFEQCSSLTSLTIPASVTSLGNDAFESCSSLLGIFFAGNAPAVASSVFGSDSKATIYYWPGTTGWSSPFAGVTALLFPFSYLANPGGVAITGYSGSAAAVVIPATINDLPVTSIGNAVFASNTTPASITIPSSVTNIGTGAFACCPSLKTITVTAPNSFYSSVNGVLFDQSQATLIQYPGGVSGSYAAMPASVTNIAAGAFAGSKLTSVVIPSAVISIGSGAFSGCASLNAFSVSAGNLFYSSADGGVLFNQNQTTLIQCPGGWAGNVSVPGYVTSIGAGAFQYCSAVTGVTLTTNLTSIGSAAFASSGLTKVAIPASVTNLASQAFSACSSLTSVILSNGVPDIGAGAFDQCPQLAGVTIAASVTNLEAAAFANCSSLTNVVFAGNAPAADLTVFAGATNATVAYLYGTTGWSNTFAGLPTLLWLPFGYSTNNGGVAITNYTGPGGAALILPPTLGGLPVTSIGNGAFEGSGLIGVTLPACVTYIGDSAFQVSTLTSVTIPCGVTYIGSQAFYGSSLTSVTIPYSVASVGGAIFAQCHQLTNAFFMGNQPVFATDGLFSGDNVTVYYLPDTGDWTEWFFLIPAVQWTPYDCLTNAGGITFTGYSGPGNTAFIIPPTINGWPVTGIGGAAFAGSSLTGLIIPGGVTNLGDHAFANCTNLTSVYFAGNAPAAAATAFSGDTNATLYYLYGTTGWSSPFVGMPAVLWLPFSYAANAGGITITGCSAPAGAALIIPPTLNGLPVTSIGSEAFGNLNQASVTIPETVTNLEPEAFASSGVDSVTIPGSILSLGSGAFEDCYNLTNVALLNGLAEVGSEAFLGCRNLATVTIAGSVTNLGSLAFGSCPGLTGVYFAGNAPATNSSVFSGDAGATLYYLPGATGWGTNFAGLSTSLWLPQIQTGDGRFGVQDNQFGFNLTWAAGQNIEVDACTNLASPVWTPVQTVALTNGSFYFGEPQWTNFPARYYRISAP
jgi:hypothetical protein